MIQSRKHPIILIVKSKPCIKIINNNITGELMSGAFEH
jgi:hypothetical protein